MIRGRDKTIEPHFLRLIYTSMVPLATMTQAPGHCWICAHCQRAPVTIGAKFNTDVGWRAAHIVIMIGIVLALMPTYAIFKIFEYRTLRLQNTEKSVKQFLGPRILGPRNFIYQSWHDTLFPYSVFRIPYFLVSSL